MTDQSDATAGGGVSRTPVKNSEWIADLLERVEFVDWDRFTVAEANEQVVSVYGWIERENDEYKDFVLARFFPEREELGFTTSSDEYTEEIHITWFGEDDLADHNACRRVEYSFDVENAIELGEQETLVTDGGERLGDGTTQARLPVGDTRPPSALKNQRRVSSGDLAALAMAAHRFDPDDVQGWRTREYDDVLREVICDDLEGAIARTSPNCEDTRGELPPVGPSKATHIIAEADPRQTTLMSV